MRPQRAGVDLHTGTPAPAIEVDGRAIASCGPHVGDIRAGAVLVATNGYTDGLCPRIQRRVMPIGSYIVATEPMSEELAASISPRGRVLLRHQELPLLLARERRAATHLRRSRVLPADLGRPDRDDPGAGPCATVHPQAADLRIDHAWGGNVAFTFDRLPHLGEHAGHPLRAGLLRQRSEPRHDLRAARWRASSDAPTEVADEPLAVRARPRSPAHRWSRRRTAADPGSCPQRENGSGSRTGGARRGTTTHRWSDMTEEQRPSQPEPIPPPDADVPPRRCRDRERRAGPVAPPRASQGETPLYKGEPLDAERGPGLGCFWIQVDHAGHPARADAADRRAGMAAAGERGAAHPDAHPAAVHGPDGHLPAAAGRRGSSRSADTASQPRRARPWACSRTSRQPRTRRWSRTEGRARTASTGATHSTRGDSERSGAAPARVARRRGGATPTERATMYAGAYSDVRAHQPS